MIATYLLAFAFSVVLLFAAEAEPQAESRDFAPFEFLLSRSPFSLPTAEESSPLTERYALTGAVEWDGRPQVFILDRNSQQRHLVTSEANASQMVLLEFFPDPDPRRMRARVQIGGETATLAFAEAPQQGANAEQMPMSASAATAVQQVPPTLSPGGTNSPRRIIRRRLISASPQPQSGAPATSSP